jgi:predicted DsbA family dithiol-disulfide isomerase
MLFRLVTPVSNMIKNKTSPPTPEKTVPELLAALADVRARKATLEREEREIMASAKAGVRKQQEALENLRKQAQDCGIDFHPENGTAAAEPAAARPTQAVLLTN